MKSQLTKQQIQKRMDKYLAPAQKDRLQTVVAEAESQSIAVYMVGGVVRDLLTGRKNLDMDLVVEGDAIAFAKKLARSLKGQLLVHKTFGTSVLTFSDGLHIDVAMARTETYPKPAALPVVKPASIEEDLGRRDFSVNSMALALSGSKAYTLLDSYKGQEDLAQKTIRVLHDKSFVDDPTRLFRAIRFEQRLGFRLDSHTLTLAKQAIEKNLVAKLSGHRLFNEIAAQLKEPDPVAGIKRARQLGLFKSIHPEWLKNSKSLKCLEQVPMIFKIKSLRKLTRGVDRWRMYLLALLYDLDSSVLKKLTRRLDFGKRYQTQVEGDIGQCRDVLKHLGRKKNPLPSAIYDHLSSCSLECLLLILAVSGKEKVRQWIELYLTKYQAAARLTLTGEDLIAMGVKPGPVFQEVFQALREERLNGQIRTRKQEETFVRRTFLK